MVPTESGYGGVLVGEIRKEGSGEKRGKRAHHKKENSKF